MQKRSRSLGSFRARIPLIGLCVVGCRGAVGRPLQGATSAGARSSRLPPASARDTSQRPAALQTQPQRIPFHPARRVERTRRTARRPGSSSLRTIRSCSHFPSRSVVRAGRLAAGEHPAARATIPPRQPPAFQAAGCSARRLAARHAQRGQQHRPALHRRNVPRPTLVQTRHASADARLRAKPGGKDARFRRWVRLSFEFPGTWG